LRVLALQFPHNKKYNLQWPNSQFPISQSDNNGTMKQWEQLKYKDHENKKSLENPGRDVSINTGAIGTAKD
jgi:hypothetical protein